MTDIVVAVLLGIVQGLTEFLPVSSSAHLILVPWIMGWDPEGIVFDVALHVGTALAVLIYFRWEWTLLIREMILGLRMRQPLANSHRKLGWLLAVGTLPALVLGLLFEDVVEQKLRSPLVTVGTLIFFGIVLLWAERKSRQNRSIADLGWADSAWIGLSQAVALVPGVSRSGITMSAAMFRDAGREAAARFSFLLSTPVIVGAGLLAALRWMSQGAMGGAQATAGPTWAIMAAGVLSAGATGFLCIRYFLRYLQTRSFLPFVVYRFALALAVLLYHLRT
ncbi:MAG: undecaprenyl-diphosphate phosphatase [Acidobacteria bacterium]|nr:undecaprenyl-diphosphate phosphatase [Acidobacteriota bacterium]